MATHLDGLKPNTKLQNTPWSQPQLPWVTWVLNSWSQWSINHQKRGTIPPFYQEDITQDGANDLSHILISPTIITSIPNNHNGSTPIIPWSLKAIGFVIFWKDWTVLSCRARNPDFLLYLRLPIGNKPGAKFGNATVLCHALGLSVSNTNPSPFKRNIYYSTSYTCYKGFKGAVEITRD